MPLIPDGDASIWIPAEEWDTGARLTPAGRALLDQLAAAPDRGIRIDALTRPRSQIKVIEHLLRGGYLSSYHASGTGRHKGAPLLAVELSDKGVAAK